MHNFTIQLKPGQKNSASFNIK